MLFQTPDEVIICEKCRPGYQASKLCLDRFDEQPYKELSGDQLIDLYSSYAVNFSSCVVCQAGTFASTSLGNQICKQCSYCERGEVVEESCSLTSDTKCAPQRNHKDSIWSTSVTGLEKLMQYIFKQIYVSCICLRKIVYQRDPKALFHIYPKNVVFLPS